MQHEHTIQDLEQITCRTKQSLSRCRWNLAGAGADQSYHFQNSIELVTISNEETANRIENGQCGNISKVYSGDWTHSEHRSSKLVKKSLRMGLIRTCEGNIRTCEGNIRTCEGNIRTCEGNIRTCEGNIRTCEGNIRTCEGNIRTCEGNIRTCEGNIRTCEGNIRTCEGLIRTCEGNIRTYEITIQKNMWGKQEVLIVKKFILKICWSFIYKIKL